VTRLSFCEVSNSDRYHVQDMDVGGFTLSETVLHAGKSTKGHSHPWPEVYIGMAGSGVLALDGEEAGLEPGVRFVVPGGVHHRVSTDGGVSFACFFIGAR